MSLEALLIPAVGTVCTALGAGLMKWGPDFFRWMTELVKGRTAVTIKTLDARKQEREETQRTYAELGTWRERARWMERELNKRDEIIAEQRRRIADLEARVKHLEALVLDLIAPATAKGGGR